jgi:Flp pilus assembly protein TadD
MKSVEALGNRRERRRQTAAARKAGVVSPPVAPFWTRDFVICLLLAIATFALYSRALGYPFIEHYDDELYVSANPHVQAGLTWQTITWAMTSTEYSNWHPLTWLSHALDVDLYGQNAGGHHFTNIVLHALSVILLFLLLKRATGATGRSLLVAALFAVHPLNVESVAWIAERKNVLSMLFFLLTLGAYGWYALKPDVRRYLLVVLLFVFALAAKPMVVTLPCVLLLLDYWPLRRIAGWGQEDLARLSEERENHADDLGSDTALFVPKFPLSRLVLEKLPLLALAAANCAVTIFAQRSYGSMRLVLPLGVRLENAVYAYAMYIWKAFWPARLTVFYPHPGNTLAGWQIGLATLFVGAMSVLVWLERDSRPYLVTGWLWYLGTLVPVIGLIQVGEQAMADRYAYLPLIGIFVMAVWGAADLADRRQLSIQTRVKVAAAVLAVFAVFTWEQVVYWRSAEDLWSHAIRVTKNNFLAEMNLGAALMTSDRIAEAVPHLQNATRIKPKDPGGYLTLAGALQFSGHPRDAIVEYQTGIQLSQNPNMLGGAYENLGRAYEQSGDYEDARASYEQALQTEPTRQSTKDALGRLDLSEAMRNVAEAPSASGFVRLGQLLQKGGRAAQARSAYEQALELDPKLEEAHKALASLGAQ